MIDTSFGTAGIFITNVIPADSEGSPHGLATSDCKIVFVTGSSGRRIALARLTRTGALDTTFNSVGTIVVTGLNSAGGSEAATSLVEQPDGKIIAAGNSGNDLRMFRVRTTGVLDTSFGPGTGIVTHDLGSTDQAYDIGLQSTGKILLTGRFGGNLFVTRYDSSGTLDTSFGTAGIYSVGGYGYGTRIKVLSNNQFYVLGSVTSDFHVLKFSVDGALDTSFGTAGIATVNIGAADYGYGLEIQSDGKLVLGGADGAGNYGVARLTTAGALDTTFGTGGTTTSPEPQGLFSQYQQTTFVLQPNGQIIVGGSDSTVTYSNFKRFNSDGSLDTTFATAGKLSLSNTEFGFTINSVSNMICLPDGKLAFAGGLSSQSSGFALFK